MPAPPAFVLRGKGVIIYFHLPTFTIFLRFFKEKLGMLGQREGEGAGGGGRQDMQGDATTVLAPHSGSPANNTITPPPPPPEKKKTDSLQ